MILVAGDAMIDRYWHGTVTRVAPDAPVPILARSREEDRPGAAAHVARTIEALGGEALTLFSPSYEKNPVVKIRLIARTQQIARIDLDATQEPIDLSKFRSLCSRARVVVISDYGKGAIPDVAKAIAIARRARLPVLVDPKASTPESYALATVLKPNHFEMQRLVGKWKDEDDLEHRARLLCARHRIEAVLMTRGALGMSLFTAKASQHISGRHLELYDVSGAGDAAIAAMAVSMARGNELKEAAHHANRAAGVAISRFGTTLVTEAEVFGL